MITINETFNILSNNPPYIFNWSFNKECVTVDVATGTATNSISSTFTSPDGCFPYIATLQLIDKDGCITAIPYTYNSPCTAFTLSSISQVGPLAYIVTSTGGLGVTYEWVYDANLFTGIVNNNSINLTLKPSTYLPVEGHTVFVRATNINGCTRESLATFTYETPLALNFIHLLALCKGNGWETTYFGLQVASVIPLDFNSIIVNLPNGVNMQQQGSLIRFTGTLQNSGQTYNIPYSIANIDGTRSNTGIITFNVPTCIVEQTIQPPIIKAS